MALDKHTSLVGANKVKPPALFVPNRSSMSCVPVNYLHTPVPIHGGRRTWIRNAASSASNERRQGRQLGITADAIQDRGGIGLAAQPEETVEERE
jgi:hypothetical protein